MQHLSPPQLHQATQLLTEFRDVFSLSNSKIGRANVPPFDVQLEHTTPNSTPLHRVPLHQQPIVKELLNHYQDLGLIEHIDSPYRAATLLVEKKNVANSAHVTDRYRLVVDYRFLNNALADSGWPAPSLQQCLDSVTGSTFVSFIDFNSGYHQILCTDHCKPLLAFSPGYGFGQWTWTVMPQGIKPASNHFQKTMEQTFSGLSDCILLPLFDDVVIKGTSFQEHLCNIRRVLTRLREAGLTLNALKCRFFQTKLPYLGHIIDCGQIRLDPARVQSLVELPAPRTAQCDTAFNTIKHLLTNAPLVRAPDSQDFFILETDASDKGEGVCLKARSYADGKKFRHYLFGKPFLLRTDNRVNTYLQSKRSPKSRKLLNWALELSEFDCEIQHIPSKNNAISDCLSRMYSINIIDMDRQPEFNNKELVEHQSKDPSICAAMEYLLSKKQFDISRLGSLQRYREHLTLSTEGHDVHNWVKSRHTCSSFNSPPQGYNKAPLRPIESSERFQLVCYDRAGTFIPASDNGNTYTLILVDHFTKWLEVIPLKDTCAPTIALAIHNQWICRYGLMQRLHSDGAPNVDGCIMHEVCNILGIGKSKLSHLHPQGDGLSEAMVKQVKACIQKQVDIHGRNWDTHLQAAAYAIRTSVNTSTNVTPAELVLGAKISTPIQLLTTSSTRSIPPSLPHHVKQAQNFANELGPRYCNVVAPQQEERHFTLLATKLIRSLDNNSIDWRFKLPACEHTKQNNPCRPRQSVKIPNNTQDESHFNTNREGNVEMVQNRNVGREEPDRVAPVDEDLPIITGGWCNMNQGNIIEQRTRSQSVT
eukprot:gene17141-18861_t